jgi:hypothetical protein
LVRLALRLYPAGDPHRLHLLHDLGYLWVEEGRFVAAQRLFGAVLSAVADAEPGLRMLVLANFVRAAAGAGDRASYEAWWSAAWRAAHESADSPQRARSFLHLAYAAHSTGQWKRATLAAGLAGGLASLHGETRVAAYAERVMNAISTHAAIGAVRKEAVPDELFAREVEGVLATD